MKRIVTWTLTIAGLLLLAGWALAQEGPLPDVDPTAAGEGLMGAISSGAVVLAVMFGGMLLVYLLTLFLVPNLRGKAKAITATVLIGVLGFFSHKVAGADWLSAAIAGVMEGMAAGKAWDLLPENTKDKVKKPVRKKRTR